MRSTLTIEDDTDQRLRKLAESEHCSYKEAVNLVLARGLAALSVAESPPRYSMKAFDAGFQPGIDLGRLNELADGDRADGDRADGDLADGDLADGDRADGKRDEA